MAEGQTYNIPAARFDWFKSKMDTLAKKAKKLTGQKSFFMAVGFHNEEDPKSRYFGQRIMEVFVSVPEPKLDGWEFIARIDHANEAGNIVRTTGLRDLPEEYRHTDPTCDHCGHKRRRRDTFVVFKDGEGFKQVGSSCLADFLGHKDVGHYARLAELLSSIRGYAHGCYDVDGIVDERYIGVEEYLYHVADDILKYGFVSRKMERESGKVSTSTSAFSSYQHRQRVSDEAKELAKNALDWALALDDSGEELSDYLHNCWVIANAPALEPRSLGLAASIVGVYERNQRPAQPSNGQFIGKIGERKELRIKVLEVRSIETSFGVSYLHKMIDAAGNSYTWFASNPALRGKIGQILRIKATIKKHETFKGANTNVVNRVNEL